MICGYGRFNGGRFVKIKNTYGPSYEDDGYAYVTIRQIREYAYITGEVYRTGAKLPQWIMVFYTSDATKKRAEVFVYE